MFPDSVTVSFRVGSFRGLTAVLAVLVLFAGLASAQVYDSTALPGPLQCTASVPVPFTMRSEGLTELFGDIVVACHGGVPFSPGAQIPTATFTVSFSTNVTSRLLGYTTTATPANTSEALLLIDEPGSGLQIGPAGYSGPQNIGPGAPQTLCGTSGAPSSAAGAGFGGCVAHVQQVGGDLVMSSSSSGYAAPANVFAGIVNANKTQVTFYGIPILPPVSAGVARVFRMTNIRINANAFPAGAFPVFAWISVGGGSSLPVNNNPLQIACLEQPGLTFQVRTPDNSAVLTNPDVSGCAAGTKCLYGMLRFRENFVNAFKTRVVPLSAAVGSGQANNLTGQNTPGAMDNSESGFIFSGITGTYDNAVAGLADFGTRLKAEFSNIPIGARLYVATSNVFNLSAPPAGNSITSFAQLVAPEAAVDGANGSLPSVSNDGLMAWNGTPKLYYYAERPVASQSATAVWEIVNANSYNPENFDFPVWIEFPSGVTGPMNISGTLAPNPDNEAFSMPAGATAQKADYPMRRFTSAAPVVATFTVTPNQACNTAANATVVMSSNVYFPFNQVTLSSTGHPSITGSITGNTGLPATVVFHLTGATPGAWDVVFWYGGSPMVTFPGAFTVQACPSCTYSLNPSSVSAAVGIGSGTVIVSPYSTWTASSDSPAWLTATGSSPYLHYFVQANPGSASRTGYITVTGNCGTVVLKVTQAGQATCTYTIAPASQSQCFTANNYPGIISVNTQSGCLWSVTGFPAWVTVSPPSSGSGPGAVSYVVASNSNPPRSAVLTVAGQTVSLSQEGAICGAVDVTCQVQVTRPLVSAPPFVTYVSPVTLKNTGPTTIAGPIYYVMDGLPRTSPSPCSTSLPCTVVTPTPTITTCQSAGSAMIQCSPSSLGPGQSVNCPMLTLKPGYANGGSPGVLTYTPRVFNGKPNQ